jgi:hypothetical protein
MTGILTAAVSLAAFAQCAMFAVFLLRTMILRPFGDMFYWIDSYFQLNDRGGVLAYLWTPHNEHHLAFIRILTALDVSVFHVSGVPFVIAASTALITVALLIFLELRRDRSFDSPFRVLALIGPMLVLTTVASVDCSIPINSVYPITLVFVVAALVLFDGEAERTRLPTPKRALAIVATVFASLGNAVGLVAWAALLWAAWRARAARWWLLVIAIVGACYCFLYIQGLPSAATDNPTGNFNFAHIWKVAEYLLTYLGLPLSRAPGLVLPARAFGGVLLLLGVIAILRDAVCPCPPTRLHRIAIGLIMVSLAAAFLAAVGRVDVEADVKVPVRYALLVAPLHIGLLALAAPWLVRPVVTQRRQTLTLVAAVAFVWALVMIQVVSGRSAAAVADEIEMTIDRFDRSARGPGLDRVVFPDLEVVDRVRAELRNIISN